MTVDHSWPTIERVLCQRAVLIHAEDGIDELRWMFACTARTEEDAEACADTLVKYFLRFGGVYGDGC